MKVLVADRLAEASLDEMRTLGVEVDYRPNLEPSELPQALGDVNILVVRGTEVNERAILAGESLNLIVRAGAGFANIDVKTASRRGIYVANCPGKNASGVAELTFALIGCLDRRVVDAVTSLVAGKWEKAEYAQSVGLRGRTLGIAGVGHVGKAVARIGVAMGLDVVGHSRSLTPQRAAELGIACASSLKELARRSDIFSVHLELTERTRGIINREIIGALPDGAFFVNTARAELVDYDALAELGAQKKLRLGLDVFPDEPEERTADFRPKILDAGCLVYATPHIGASTDEGQRAIANETASIVRSFIVKGEVPNVVNVRAASRARYQLVVRHVDKVGSLANVLGVLKRHGINIQEIENSVFEGGKAGCAKIRTDTRPSEACLSEIMAFSDEILHVDLVTLPILA